MKPSTPDDRDKKLTERQRRRLDAAIHSRIDYYRRCLKLTRNVNSVVFEAGMELFGSESTLALWLCEPAPALNNIAPLRAMGSAKGRMRVANILRASIHGVYL